ncbi:MAG: alpha/beta hydrolase [Lachnospiraceae bacterium]|nr:alpha/beta hydrolase [Lachnospiraceae bacterium]
MYIEDDGIKLHIELAKPESGKDKYPLVIIIHGITGNMNERHLTALSEMFVENGYAALRVDMYGHGESGGAFRDHTYFKWMTNAMTVIDYARSLDFVSDIYLCGHSQGGVTVMLAAALKYENIKGLIALSPSVMRPEQARCGLLFGNKFDPRNIPEEFPLWADKVLGGNYVRVSRTIHVENYIDSYDKPVLIVVGTEDNPELVASCACAADRYSNCRYVEIKGDTHCYDNHLDQMVGTVREWMIGGAGRT